MLAIVIKHENMWVVEDDAYVVLDDVSGTQDYGVRVRTEEEIVQCRSDRYGDQQLPGYNLSITHCVWDRKRKNAKVKFRIR